MTSYKVVFQPGNLEREVTAGSTLMTVLNQMQIELDFPCGGNGKCGKCRVRILEGAVAPSDFEQESLTADEISNGIRLACVTKVENSMTVELPGQKLAHNILASSEGRKAVLDPHFAKTFLVIDQPTPEDWRSDCSRVQAGLATQLSEVQESDGSTGRAVKWPIDLLRQLPKHLRENEYRITAVTYGGELVGIEPGDTTGALLGMAFDIGTTTIVGYLMDLSTGQELAVVSILNPQTKFGGDVISRVTYAGQAEDGVEQLQRAVVGAVNQLVGEAAEQASVSRNQIYAVTIAANTCMHHLFLGISPKSIAVAPYVPVISEPLVAPAPDLAIEINSVGRIMLLPNIAGFVGADTAAVLLATEMEQQEQMTLMIDIGTNGEIALGSADGIYACSAAAGPAFEGAQISSGMRGAVGAIDHIFFGDQVDYSVIGGVAPIGICGSALLDAVAGLLELGIVDSKGRILKVEGLPADLPAALAKRVVEAEDQLAFLVAKASETGHGRPIMITQGDIRQLQLAKGAMAAGVQILLEKRDIPVEGVGQVLLAGAFGNYLNPHSACVIGLIPQQLESKIRTIGNAAGAGAKTALLSASEYRRAAAIAEQVRFVELGSYPTFNRIFAKSTYFKTR